MTPRYSRMKTVKPQSFDKPIDISEKHYPTIYLSLADIPAAKNWKIGEKYKIMLEVRQKSMTQNDDKDKGSVTFDILKIGTE